MANYNWQPESDIIIKGSHLDFLFKYINIEVEKSNGEKVKEFDRIDYLRASAQSLQDILKSNVESGTIKEVE